MGERRTEDLSFVGYPGVASSSLALGTPLMISILKIANQIYFSGPFVDNPRQIPRDLLHAMGRWMTQVETEGGRISNQLPSIQVDQPG